MRGLARFISRPRIRFQGGSFPPFKFLLERSIRFAPRSTAGARCSPSGCRALEPPRARAGMHLVDARRFSVGTYVRDPATLESSRNAISPSASWFSGLRDEISRNDGLGDRTSPDVDGAELRRSDRCARFGDQAAPGIPAARILSSSSRSIGFTEMVIRPTLERAGGPLPARNPSAPSQRARDRRGFPRALSRLATS